MSSDLFIALTVAAIAGPELDNRIAQYESGENTSRDEMLRDLKAATNLASMLAMTADAVLNGGVK